MKSQKGFTIIELIVVIAIIAILAAIVTVNVTKYLNKSRDASILSDLTTLHTAGTDYVTDPANGSYANFDSSPEYNKAYSAIQSAGGLVTPGFSDDHTKFCASSTTASDSSKAFCVDSKGYIGNGTCNTDTGICDPTGTVIVNPGGGNPSGGNPQPGVCGTASQAYASGSTSFGSDTFCTPEGSTPTPTPTFPTVDSPSFSWTCSGIDGGSPSDTCTATLTAGGNVGSPNGSRCNEDSDCASNVCYNNTCVAGIGPGISCSQNIDCSTNGGCVNGVCLVSQGSVCSQDSDCTTGNCVSGTCQYSNVSLGGQCAQYNDCSSPGFCQGGVCVVGQGYSCSQNSDCSTGNCESGNCGPTPGSVSEGNSCSQNADCSTDGGCANGYCAVNSGESCSQSHDCVSQSCNYGNGTCD